MSGASSWQENVFVIVVCYVALTLGACGGHFVRKRVGLPVDRKTLLPFTIGYFVVGTLIILGAVFLFPWP
jgi:hypothetical protein